MQAILFDLDNTLTHRAQSIARYAAEFVSNYRTAFKQPVEAAWITDKILEVDAGGYGGHDLRCRMLSQLDIWKTPVEPQQLLGHWFSWFPFHPVAMPGLYDTLVELKRAGYTLGVITNGKSAVQRAKIDALAIGHLLDCVIVSGELGVMKPSPQIFEAALAKLGCEASEAFFVGDHPRNDYQGALQAGMVPIWFSGFVTWPAEQEPARLQVESLAAVPGLVRDIVWPIPSAAIEEVD